MPVWVNVMSELREQQRRFHAALFDDAGLLPQLLRPGSAEHSFAVYRNNLEEGTRKALLADYPVVARLVGSACFRTLAHDYRRAHPSRTGNLGTFGAGFATFLEQRYGTTRYAYLADVARLERAIDDVLCSPLVPALPLDALANVAAEHHATLHVLLQPACRLLRSPWPVLDIWRANQADADDAPVDLSSGTVHLVVQRTGEHTVLRPLEAHSWTLLSRLAAGATLASALAALDVDAGARALRQIFAWELVCALDSAPFITNGGISP